MVELYKNPSGDHIFLSPYHHDNIGTHNRMRLTSVESNSTDTGSFLMRFDRSSTLMSIFRSVRELNNKFIYIVFALIIHSPANKYFDSNPRIRTIQL